MPRIFDNIEQKLLPALQQTMEVTDHADFCVGYFNLRGWKQLDRHVERWSGGEGNCCRLLVGMHRPPAEELRAAMGLVQGDGEIDNQTALRLKKKLALDYRDQLATGTPNNEDEACLRRLAKQIRDKKVAVKLFLGYPLHAKLYLLFRRDPISPIISYLGSSNLTFAGLSGQGELNVDVPDHDACTKLAKWFQDRWDDRWCIDISAELVQIIEESWAREALIPPYHIYVKMAYHLSQEARAGLSEFRIPLEFRRKLFEFQSAAVRIAAHHLNKRGGVLIGDVVGLGKTLMATALARIVQDDRGISTLILCPKNLVKMWQHHADTYGLQAKIISLSMVAKELPNVPGRFRLIILDESHNLRNREGKRYRAIHEFIQQTDSKCVLLSGSGLTKAKQDLRQKLDSLDAKLDHYLAGEYGIDPKKPAAFAKWKTSHQPFHWFAEFYGIMTAGGFDVIIGNPPWKEYAAAKKDYTVQGYVTEPCGNLHCLCTERSLRIRHPMGRMSFIVQLPMVSSSRMVTVRRLLSQSSSALHVIPFDDRPGKLFDGLEHCRAVIFLSEGRGKEREPSLLTTRYQRWATEVRANLFAQIEFATLVGQPLFDGTVPKYANDLQESLFRRVKEKCAHAVSDFCSKRETKAFIFYQEATGYWVKATFGLPYYAKNGKVGPPAHGRYLFFSETATAHAACALLNSSLFYAFFLAYGDCFHLSDTLASGFPAAATILADDSLVELSKKLMTELRGNAERKTINTKAGDKIAYDEFYAGRSKSIIDEIDRVLAKHYGFTDEELDFIINYDIKYRLGQDGGEDDE